MLTEPISPQSCVFFANQSPSSHADAPIDTNAKINSRHGAVCEAFLDILRPANRK